MSKSNDQNEANFEINETDSMPKASADIPEVPDIPKEWDGRQYGIITTTRNQVNYYIEGHPHSIYFNFDIVSYTNIHLVFQPIFRFFLDIYFVISLISSHSYVKYEV